MERWGRTVIAYKRQLIKNAKPRKCSGCGKMIKYKYEPYNFGEWSMGICRECNTLRYIRTHEMR